MSLNTLNQLLEKTSDPDKDARFMATNDLCIELGRDIKIDVNMERRICQAVLKQLDDQSNDVQSIAVKCLGILFKKVQEAQVGEICDKLCSLILDGKEELRDIYSIGLKTLISDVPEGMGRPVAQKLATRLLGGIQQEKVLTVKFECLDNLTELLKRFGREVDTEHERMIHVVLEQLKHQTPAVRKRANTCLGALAVVIPDALLNKLMEDLLTRIEVEKKPRDVQTLIQTIGTISRTVGHRLGKHLSKIVPLFLRFCGDPDEEAEQDDERNELRELCFAAFESVVLRCPREVSPHLESIINVALGFMKYDPNYTYEDDDVDGEPMDQDEYDDDDGEDYGGSDDDDTSWKVRRAALKVLSAVITSRPELLQFLYERCADPLISRFKEREENVRLDVISCFNSLLKATLALASHHKSYGHRLTREDSGRNLQPLTPRKGGAPMLNDDMDTEGEESVLQLLRERVEAIIKASDKQLREGKDKAIKTKSAVLNMLQSLANVLKGGFQPTQLNVIVEDLKRCLKDKSQGLKLDALSLLHTILETHPPAVLHPHMAALVPLVTAGAEDEWYKIVAQALRVTSLMIAILRPIDSSTRTFVAVESAVDVSSFVAPLYAAISPRLAAHDIDQEIKESAITAMGKLVSHLGDHMTKELPGVLETLMDKLKNEVTRTPALRALALIATSPLNIDLSPIMETAVTELALFLRQQSRPLKLATLDTLVALVKSNSRHMSPKLFELTLTEAANLISDSDLHLSDLALSLTVSVLKASPDSSLIVANQSLPRVYRLAGSPLLQGSALRSLLHLLDTLVSIGAAGLDAKTLINQLESIALQEHSGAVPKQVIANVAICMARVSAHSKSEKDRNAFIRQLVENTRSGHDLTRHLALLCIGELGAQRDLSAAVPELKNVILNAFESGNEETKTAAAYALGHVTAGKADYLQLILDLLSEERRPQYLLLLSLKEAITTSHSHTLDLGKVLPLLFRYAQSSEEGVRNMVAECLGTLSNLNPAEVCGALRAQADEAATDKHTRWTIATALKFAVSSYSGRGAAASYLDRNPDLLVATLQYAMDIDVSAETVTTEDLEVLRATLLTVNTVAHHQPKLLLPVLHTHATPLLYKTIELKLQRKVNLGPFTHLVDDGLPLRKASLSCVDTMLDSVAGVLDLSSLMDHIVKGLSDKDDVKLLCHQTVVKVCRLSPVVVQRSLEAILPPIETDALKTVKDQQVVTEVERTNDMIRSALRALVAISRIEGSAQDVRLQQTLDRLMAKDHLRALWSNLVVDV